MSAISGHELYHKREWYNKLAGSISYAKMYYSHSIIEHLQVHHKWVSTMEDTDTARKGGSFWAFFLRSYIESYTKCWDLETKRVKKEKGNETSTLSIILNNKITLCVAIHIAIMATIYYFLGF